jgi:trimethylamine---corrinoid protein Co-methyltransferase
MSRAGRTSDRRRRERGGAGISQLPWQPLRNPLPPVELLPEDAVERIHRASLRILAETGMNFLLPEAREILRAAGAEVEPGTTRVRFDPALIEESIRTAPARFTLHARNPSRHVPIGGDRMIFAVIGSAPNVSDLDRGRRAGTFADYCDLVRLSQCLDIVHYTGGYPVEPTDVPPDVRHLEAVSAMARLTDKTLYGYALGRRRILDAIEIARIARGISEAQLEREPSLTTVVNANSPLQYDGPMLWGMIELARRNQPVIVTPFTLAGALAQQNAEALAGIAFIQMVRAGAPVVYGGFTSNVDMKSGAPAFGTPEYVKATVAGGQLARRYALPYRASNACASNAPDAQAIWESQMSIWACALGGVNVVKHALGWLEGGLCASFEKVILDAEMLQHLAAFFQPFAVDDASLAVEAIAEVGPGGHFFASPHTLRATRPPSISPSSPTGATSRPGRRTARWMPPAAPTGSGSSCSPTTSRRPWTWRSPTSWRPSSSGARPRAARRRTEAETGMERP